LAAAAVLKNGKNHLISAAVAVISTNLARSSSLTIVTAPAAFQAILIKSGTLMHLSQPALVLVLLGRIQLGGKGSFGVLHATQ